MERNLSGIAIPDNPFSGTLHFRRCTFNSIKKNEGIFILMNIVYKFISHSKMYPHKNAIIAPVNRPFSFHYESITFSDLENLSNKYAIGLKKKGIVENTLTLVFVKPGIDFPAITLALFKIGAIPIFMDPGMGKKNLFKSIKNVKPQAMIAPLSILIATYFFRNIFKSIKIRISNFPINIFNIHTFKKFKKIKKNEFNPVLKNNNENAAILFTSGGTGTPKGVVYTHEIFEEQTNRLQSMFNLTSHDIDFPAFPLFSIFTLSMGITSCIPNMDASKPAALNPKKLVQNILDQRPSFLAGSPAIWKKVVNYCLQMNIKLPSVKHIVMFGAPVELELHKKLQCIMNGNSYAPYGATESLPVSNSNGKEMISYTNQTKNFRNGVCVGKPVKNIDVQIIKINNAQIEYLSDKDFLPIDTIGEIIVSGKVVTPSYWNLPEKTKLSKIIEQTPSKKKLWHRMGDLGYFDKNGYLWFCGRKDHRVTYYKNMKCSINCEQVFLQHKNVSRAALIGLGPFGSHTPAIVIEPIHRSFIKGIDKVQLEYELQELAKKHKHTMDIQTFFFKRKLPVDERHNVKIDRLKLKKEVESGRLK
jgi:acyl-CoA synthetase (AMP-forming)/AMP-acid ligase II